MEQTVHIDWLSHTPMVWTPSHPVGYPLLAIATCLVLLMLFKGGYSLTRFWTSKDLDHRQQALNAAKLALRCGTGSAILGVVCTLFDLVFGVGSNPVPNNDLTVLVLATAATLMPLLWGVVLMFIGWIVNFAIHPRDRT